MKKYVVGILISLAISGAASADVVKIETREQAIKAILGSNALAQRLQRWNLAIGASVVLEKAVLDFQLSLPREATDVICSFKGDVVWKEVATQKNHADNVAFTSVSKEECYHLFDLN